MHESSLGKQLLTAALGAEGRTKGARVRRICAFIAETERLDPEAIAFHFAAHARGTAADGAKLEIEVRWVEARCEACGATYKPDHHLLLCPACGSTEASLLGETGVGIETIEVDDV